MSAQPNELKKYGLLIEPMEPPPYRANMQEIDALREKLSELITKFNKLVAVVQILEETIQRKTK